MTTTMASDKINLIFQEHKRSERPIACFVSVHFRLVLKLKIKLTWQLSWKQKRGETHFPVVTFSDDYFKWFSVIGLLVCISDLHSNSKPTTSTLLPISIRKICAVFTFQGIFDIHRPKHTILSFVSFCGILSAIFFFKAINQ